MFVVQTIASVLFLAALAGVAYQIAATILVRRFTQQPLAEPSARPPMTVLKPLAGDEPGLADNLRALCRQSYPGLRIVCGVPSAADPAYATAMRVRGEFPAVDMAIVERGSTTARNGKVGSLIAMLPHARHDVLVLADSDVRAGWDYLDRLAEPLAAPGVGLVTCLYLAHPEDGAASRLEALWINHAFLPAVLVARAIGRRDGCFGATIALRREILEQAGGFEPLRDRLADDWALGAAVRKLGLSIALAARPVDMIVHQPDMASALAHELRWGRTIASIDPVGHGASIVTQPVMLAALAMLLGWFAAPMVVLFAVAAIVRLAAIRLQQKALGLGAERPDLLLVREFLTFALFVATFFGRTVRWRGVNYRIRRDGSMELLDDPAQ